MNASIANWNETGHIVKHQVLTDLVLVMTFQFSVFAREVDLQVLLSIHGCQLVLNSLRQASALKYFMRFFYIKLQNLSTQKCNNFLIFYLQPSYNTAFTESYYLHFFCIPNISTKFHLDNIFPESATLWNSFPCGCFHEHYNLDIIMSRV